MALLTKRKLKFNTVPEEVNDEIIIDDDEIESLFEIKKKTKPKCTNQNKKTELQKKNKKSETPQKKLDEKINNIEILVDSDDEIIYENSITVEKISDSPIKEKIIETSFVEQEETIIDTHTYVKNISLKFRYKGSIHCLTFKSNEKFKDKLDELSKILDLNSDNILLMVNNQIISLNTTPGELNLSVVDMIIVLEKQSVVTVGDEDSYGSFKIKFRDCDSRRKTQDLTLNMHQSDEFKDVFLRYASLKKLDINDIIFEFDGESVKFNETPDDLDMESDSLIDVKIKKK